MKKAPVLISLGTVLAGAAAVTSGAVQVEPAPTEHACLEGLMHDASDSFVNGTLDLGSREGRRANVKYLDCLQRSQDNAARITFHIQ